MKNQIEFLKVISHYLDNQVKNILLIIIKYLELMDLLSGEKLPLHDEANTSQPDNPMEKLSNFLEEISPFLSEEERDKLSDFKNIISNFESIQKIQETLEVMKDLFPEGFDNTNPEELNNIMNIFM